MGIGAPSAEQIAELKAPLMTLAEVAVQRGEAVGTFRRKLREGRFPDLPHHVLGPRTRRFHAAQALAWCDGDEVPQYPKVMKDRQKEEAPTPPASPEPAARRSGKVDLMGRPV